MTKSRAEPSGQKGGTAFRARAGEGTPAGDAVVSAMRDPDFYPHRPATVESRETHISWVFLAGERAYKVKKPVRFPFVDYTTLPRRRLMCQREVELNRGLAPDTYLGVRSIVSRGGRLSLAEAAAPDAVEYVVEMRRFDESRTLAARLSAGAKASAQVEAVARRLAEFHAGQAAASTDGMAHLVRLKRMANENFATLLPYAPLLGRRRLAAAERFVDAFTLARAPAITRRAQAGLVRDGHGDLRAEHVVLEDGIEMVDCVEFDSDLRRIDVGEDLAFLVMDLTFKGGPELARDLVRAYRASGGDPGDDALLAFHAAVRAWVRTKVACLRSDEPGVEEHRRTADAGEAQSLFAVGERLAWRARGPLVLAICGVPGSGKSYLAAALRESSGLEVVASDVVRKRLGGLAPTERAGPERYSDAASRATYRHMGERARGEIQRGGCLIVDATFRRRADRECFRDGLAACPPPVVFVECRSPADVLAVRARERDRRGGSVSDASAELVQRLAGEFEPLDEVAPESHVVLRTDRAVADVALELVDTLDRRLEALSSLGDHPPVKR